MPLSLAPGFSRVKADASRKAVSTVFILVPLQAVFFDQQSPLFRKTPFPMVLLLIRNVGSHILNS
jgi:hypothetical protein